MLMVRYNGPSYVVSNAYRSAVITVKPLAGAPVGMSGMERQCRTQRGWHRQREAAGEMRSRHRYAQRCR